MYLKMIDIIFLNTSNDLGILIICQVIATSYVGISSSEFQELEAIPTSSIVEGPLERGPLASSTLPDIQDEPLERFFVGNLFSSFVLVGWLVHSIWIKNFSAAFHPEMKCMDLLFVMLY